MAKQHYAYFDIETQSAKHIDDAEYISDPSTRMLTFQWYDTKRKRFGIWVNPCVPFKPFDNNKRFNILDCSSKLPDLVKYGIAGHTLVAHNCEMFDARVLKRFVKLSPNTVFSDTIHLARRLGLPGGLDRLAHAFGIGAKASDDVLKRVCVAKYLKGKLTYFNPSADDWPNLLEYCYEDARLLRDLHGILTQFEMPKFEDEILDIHQRINNRGFKIDVEYASTLIDLWNLVGEDARIQLAKITKGKLTGDDIRSPNKVKDYLLRNGLDLRSLDKRIVDRLIEGEDVTLDTNEHVLEVLKLRQLANRSSTGKIVSFLKMCDANGIIRHWANYFGAHPGRWSGRGCQPHNFARPDTRLDFKKLNNGLTFKNVKAESKRLKISNADTLTSLTRGIVIPREGKYLGIVDYSQVEARCVAFMAKCTDLLGQFESGVDVYREFAAKYLFGIPPEKVDETQRFIAKQSVLGSIYQAGGPKFDAMMKQYRVDLSKQGLTGKACVDAFRKAYPEIPMLWRRMQDAAIRAVDNPGQVCEGAWCITFEYINNCLCMTLPSGRVMRYWDAEIRMEFPTKFESRHRIPHLYYMQGAKGVEANLYGGKLTENGSQASCRDIHGINKCKLEYALLPVVLDVHDEVVCELDREDRIHEQASIMSTPPLWAEGFPLAVEGLVANRYGKFGSQKVKYQKGRKK